MNMATARRIAALERSPMLKEPADMTMAELRQAITVAVGYVPEGEELRRMVAETEEGGQP